MFDDDDKEEKRALGCLIGMISSLFIGSSSTNDVLKDSLGAGTFDTTTSDTTTGGSQEFGPIGSTGVGTGVFSLCTSYSTTEGDGGEVVGVIVKKDEVLYNKIDERANRIYNVFHSENKKMKLNKPGFIIYDDVVYSKFLSVFFDKNGRFNMEKLQAIKQILEESE